VADQIQAQQFPRTRAGEDVLFESRNGPIAATDYRAAVSDLVARLERIPAVAEIESPLEPGNRDRISKDGRAALLSFMITGDPVTAQDRVAPALAATAAVARAHPGLFIAARASAAGGSSAAGLIRCDADARRTCADHRARPRPVPWCSG
jgi:RND superfamily putative drug exporter